MVIDPTRIRLIDRLKLHVSLSILAGVLCKAVRLAQFSFMKLQFILFVLWSWTSLISYRNRPRREITIFMTTWFDPLGVWDMFKRHIILFLGVNCLGYLQAPNYFVINNF